MIALLLPLSLLPLSLPPAQAAAPAAEQQARQEQQEQEQVQYHVAQAKKFQRNQWYGDAAAELRAALDLPAGRRSWAVWWLALQIDYARGDIPGALDHATGAVSVAATPEERDEALRFRAFLLSQFGFVEITGPAEGAVARILLDAQSPQLDPDLRARTEAVALLLRARHTLGPGPLRVGLPAGNYTLNGLDVLVQPAQTVTVALSPAELRADGLAAPQPPRLDLLLGAAGLIPLAGISGHLPSPSGGLLLSWPVRRLLLLAGIDAAPARFAVEAPDAPDTAWDVRGLSAALGLGTELFSASPFHLRPAASLQYRLLPGLHRSAGSAPPADLWLTAQGWGPALSLAAEYRRPGGLPVGLRAEAAYWMLTLPAAGTAADPDGAPLHWSLSAPDRQASSLEIRLQAYTGFTF